MFDAHGRDSEGEKKKNLYHILHSACVTEKRAGIINSVLR